MLNRTYNNGTFSNKHLLRNKGNWLLVKLESFSTEESIMLKGRKQQIDKIGAEQVKCRTET